MHENQKPTNVLKTRMDGSPIQRNKHENTAAVAATRTAALSHVNVYIC